jgi:hypothetical protein
MSAGGGSEGLDDGEGAGVAVGVASAKAGAARERDNESDSRAAEAAGRRCLAACFEAGTVEKVQGRVREVPPPSPPRPRCPFGGDDTERMKLSRPVSWFLLAFGVWSWVIWITFVKNLAADGSGLAFDDGDPTAYFWVHLTLAVVSFVLGTIVGGIGLRGLRALRRTS